MKIEIKPLNMVEAKKIAEASKENNKEILIFIKKFTKINEKKAEELKKDLESLGMMKMKHEHIAKIIDLLPEDSSDLNKIFVDVSLDENEINKLLETIKKHT